LPSVKGETRRFQTEDNKGNRDSVLPELETLRYLRLPRRSLGIGGFPSITGETRGRHGTQRAQSASGRAGPPDMASLLFGHGAAVAYYHSAGWVCIDILELCASAHDVKIAVLGEAAIR